MPWVEGNVQDAHSEQAATEYGGNYQNNGASAREYVHVTQLFVLSEFCVKQIKLADCSLQSFLQVSEETLAILRW